MKKTLQLKGLDCAACAAELEEELAATEGVTSVSVTFVTQKLTVECESEKVLALVKDKANHFEEVPGGGGSWLRSVSAGGGRKNSFASFGVALCGLCDGFRRRTEKNQGREVRTGGFRLSEYSVGRGDG